MNENLEVVDGQHRLEICKKLKTCVEYIIRDGLDIHDTLNMNKVSNVWNIKDLIDTGVKRGIPLCVRLKSISDETKVPVEVLIGLYNYRYMKRDALMSLLNNADADKVDIEEFIEGINSRLYKFMDVMNIIKGDKKDTYKVSSTFINGLCPLFETDGYRHEIFLNQLSKYKHMITLNNSRKIVVEQLETV